MLLSSLRPSDLDSKSSAGVRDDWRLLALSINRKRLIHDEEAGIDRSSFFSSSTRNQWQVIETSQPDC